MFLNNKGQSLVLFILILPIMLLVLVGVIDIGFVIYNKQDVDGINKMVLDYGLDNINSNNVVDEMEKLAYLNNKDIKVKIIFKDMEFYIKSSCYVDGVFSDILNIDGYEIVSEYKGYVDNNEEHKIKKIK